VARAVERALFALASFSAIATAAMTLATDAQTAIIAVARAEGFNMANITLPTLFTEALAFEAVAMTRAIGHHLASFGGTISTRPAFLALTSGISADAIARARWVARTEGLRAINPSSNAAEALAMHAKAPARAVVGAQQV